jgi:tetratricopeptide (TPR) repeat protein
MVKIYRQSAAEHPGFFWFYGALVWFILSGFSLFAQTGPSARDAAGNYRTGRDLEARGRMDEAAPYYNEAVRITMDEIGRNAATADSYVVLTWTLLRQRKYTDVITWGERGLLLFTNDSRIFETMGEAYFYLGNYNASLGSMQRYVDALPQGERSSVAYFFIGEIYRLTQRFLLADIAYTTAVRLQPNLSLWWYRLGSVREAAGDPVPAVEAYTQALRLDPEYREASEGIARLSPR